MRLPTVFGMRQCVEIGVEEEEKEKRQSKRETRWEGGWPPGEASEKEKNGRRSSLGGPEDCESASCTLRSGSRLALGE